MRTWKFILLILSLSSLFGCFSANAPSNYEMAKYVDTEGQSRSKLVRKLYDRFENNCVMRSLGDCDYKVMNIELSGFELWVDRTRYIIAKQDYAYGNAIEDKSWQKIKLNYDNKLKFISAPGITSSLYWLFFGCDDTNCRAKIGFSDKEEAIEFYGLMESIKNSPQ